MAEDSCMFCGATPCECGAGKKPAAKPQPKKIHKRVPKSEPKPKVETSVPVRTRKPKAAAAPPPSSKRVDPFEEPVRTLHFFGMLSKEAVIEHEHRLTRKKPNGILQRREEEGSGGVGSGT